jgi:transposase-like protein
MTSALKVAERCRWPGGVVCPSCGLVGEASRLRGGRLFHCSSCRTKFTITVGTVLEHSRVPVERWVAAVGRACSAEGVSAREAAEIAGVTYKSAVAMMHRLREVSGKEPLVGRIDRGSFQFGKEKRISFSPLGWEEALTALFRVRRQTAEERLHLVDRAWAEMVARARR